MTFSCHTYSWYRHCQAWGVFHRHGRCLVVLACRQWWIVCVTIIYDVISASVSYRDRAPHIPLPDGPGLVKLPLGQMDFHQVFYINWIGKVEKFWKAGIWRKFGYIERCNKLHIWIMYVNIVCLSYHCLFMQNRQMDDNLLMYYMSMLIIHSFLYTGWYKSACIIYK